jgi:hypothetical protein
MMIPLFFSEITLHPASRNLFANFQSRLKKFDDRLRNSMMPLTVPPNSRTPTSEKERGRKSNQGPHELFDGAMFMGQNTPERRNLKYKQLMVHWILDSPVESKPFPQGVVHGPRN